MEPRPDAFLRKVKYSLKQDQKKIGKLKIVGGGIPFLFIRCSFFFCYFDLYDTDEYFKFFSV